MLLIASTEEGFVFIYNWESNELICSKQLFEGKETTNQIISIKSLPGIIYFVQNRNGNCLIIDEKLMILLSLDYNIETFTKFATKSNKPSTFDILFCQENKLYIDKLETQDGSIVRVSDPTMCDNGENTQSPISVIHIPICSVVLIGHEDTRLYILDDTYKVLAFMDKTVKDEVNS
jgi:hypothetical protein